jgi:hypothetical protein
MADTKTRGQLIAGVVIVVIGLLMVVERIGGFYVGRFWELWPLIVVAVGIARLSGDSEQRRSGLTIVIVGCWLLLNTLGLFDFGWRNSWPLLLIGLGVGKLVYPDDDDRLGGLLMLLIGGWALINVLELWGVHWETSWPFAIIIVGLVIVAKALFGGSPAEANGSKAEQTNDSA